MTSAAFSRSLPEEVMAVNAVSVCPSFPEQGYFSDMMFMAYGTDADSLRLMTLVVEFDPFSEDHHVPAICSSRC